jgi:hypothetical protein
MLSKYVNIYVFLISFAVGMFVVYTTLNDEQRKIYVYPTPENVDLILYRDKANTCFGFKEKEVQCPTDESKITKTVAQA